MIPAYNAALTILAIAISAAGLAWTAVALALRVRLNRLPDDAELQAAMLRDLPLLHKHRLIAKGLMNRNHELLAESKQLADVIFGTRKPQRGIDSALDALRDSDARTAEYARMFDDLRIRFGNNKTGSASTMGRNLGGQGGCSFYLTPSEMRYLRDHEEGKR